MNEKKDRNTQEKQKNQKKKETVGEAALRLSSESVSQEVGETYNEMEKRYHESMEECLEKHKKHPNYFILVLRKKEPFFENILRQWFIAPRFEKPKSTRLKLEYPLYDHDVWEVKKGTPIHLWTLPGPDAWHTILKNPINHDPTLIKWMKMHMRHEDI